LKREEAKGNLFGVVERMASRNKDVVGGGDVKDKEVQVENSRMLGVWREYYKKLLNEEFMWKRDGLETLAPTEGPCEGPSIRRKLIPPGNCSIIIRMTTEVCARPHCLKL